MLQRMAEDMTYAYLLDRAASHHDPTVRLALVTAFACSNYETTVGRVAKPFNPLLGETYEFVNLQGCSKYRFMSEQVSHHPPISTCQADSLEEDGVTPSHAWHYTSSLSAGITFRGTSLDVRPVGWSHVRIRTPADVWEHYSFRRVTTSIAGIITGRPVMTHHGEMIVRDHTNDNECIIRFGSKGWRSRNPHDLEGTIYSGSERKAAWQIVGQWSSFMIARRISSADNNSHSSSTSDDSLNSMFPLSNLDEIELWRGTSTSSAQAFNLTNYTVQLNDLTPGLLDWLPSTDSRRRPDLRLFENGKYNEADDMKIKLEAIQRAKKKKREAGGCELHRASFFEEDMDCDTLETYWRPRLVSNSDESAYWAQRSQKQWTRGSIDIFGGLGA